MNKLTIAHACRRGGSTKPDLWNVAHIIWTDIEGMMIKIMDHHYDHNVI